MIGKSISPIRGSSSPSLARIFLPQFPTNTQDLFGGLRRRCPPPDAWPGLPGRLAIEAPGRQRPQKSARLDYVVTHETSPPIPADVPGARTFRRVPTAWPTDTEPGYGIAVRDPLPHPHACGQVLLARNDVGGNRRRGLAAPHFPSDGEGHGGGPGKVHTTMFRPKDYAGPCLDAEKFWFVVAGGSVVTLFLTLVLFLFLAQARDQATALQNAGTKVRRYKGSQFFAQGCTDFH